MDWDRLSDGHRGAWAVAALGNGHRHARLTREGGLSDSSGMGDRLAGGGHLGPSLGGLAAILVVAAVWIGAHDAGVVATYPNH